MGTTAALVALTGKRGWAGLALAVLLAACAPVDSSPRLVVAAWNVESGGADPQVMAQTHLQPYRHRIDVWGFAEVESNAWMETFRRVKQVGWGADYRWLLGRSGGKDRLGVLYNARRLTYLRHEELDQAGGTSRSPLVVEFEFQPARQRFLLVVNHLHRGDAQRRHRQAQFLNEWARSQTLPLIMVGDFNFDWDIDSNGRRRDAGFDLLTQGGVLRWVQPQVLVSTQCNPQFNSILDFVFVGGAAQNWPAASDILYPEPSYCTPANRRTYSDHRPVRAVFDVVTP